MASDSEVCEPAQPPDPQRRALLRKGVVGAGVAGVVWSAPRIDGLSVRPAYAAAATDGGGDAGADVVPQDFSIDFPVVAPGANQSLALGNFGTVTLHATPTDNSFDVPIDSDNTFSIQQIQVAVTWDGLPGSCGLTDLDVDYTTAGGVSTNANSQNNDPGTHRSQFLFIPMPVNAAPNPHFGVHARFTCL